MEAFAPLDTIIPLFLKAGKGSSEHFGNVAAGFFTFTAWVAIAWAGLRIMAGTDGLEGGALQATGWLLRLYILGVIGAFLLPTIIPALIEGAFSIGTGVSGGKMSAADFMMPTRLAKVGWTEVEKLMKHSMSRVNGVGSFVANIPTLFYFMVASFVVLASFVGMIIMVILSFAFFIMEGIGALINLGFMGGDKLAWIGRGGPATLLSRFNQMIIMSASLSLGTTLFERVRLSGEPSVAQAVVAAVVALIVAILAYKSEQIGASITGGMPGVQTNGYAGTALGIGAGLLGAGAGAGASLGRSGVSALGNAFSGGSTPPTPNLRDGFSGSPGGGPGSGGTSGSGSGHGRDPFGPSGMTSAASRAGNGMGQTGPRSPSQEAAQVASRISAEARQLPRGSGDAAEAPTPSQWRDAGLMGTDITGMSRGQANAALEAHQKWYQGRGTGGDAAAPSRPPAMPLASDVSAPADWRPVGGGGTGGSAPSPAPAAPTGGNPRTALGAAPTSSNSADQPPMRGVAGNLASRLPAPFSGGEGHRMMANEHRNDGRFQIGDSSLQGVGFGGGWGGTGYRGTTPRHISMKSTAVSALTGGGYWQRRDVAGARQLHLGSPGRAPRAPRSAAATL